MRIPWSVRLRREPLSGRSIVRRTAVVAAAAACVGLTAASWVPSVQADTSGTGTWGPTPATRSITVSTDGSMRNCIHTDLQAANGLYMPGRCTGFVDVTNTGDEAVISTALSGWTPSGTDVKVTPCALHGFIVAHGIQCAGPPDPSSAYGVGLLGFLPGSSQFAVRALRTTTGTFCLLVCIVPATATNSETMQVDDFANPEPVCDLAFGGTGTSFGGCPAAVVNQRATEAVVLFGASAGTQVTGFSVKWEADPLQPLPPLL